MKKRNTKQKFIRTALILTILASFLFTGCGQAQEIPEGKAYEIYYLSSDETHVISVTYYSTTEGAETLAAELLEQMEQVPQVVEYKAIPDGTYGILSSSLSKSQLTVDLDEGFGLLDPIKATLIRAALARTLCQISGIDAVALTVAGEPLADASGNAIGPMTADMFIDNTGDEINAYERAKLTLYFANEDGTGLKTVNKTVVYNSNISMEKLVMEQLLLGPGSEDAYPVLSPDIKLLSVTAQDGICYVNLDEAFLTSPYVIEPEVTIYGIVNSLAELSYINKVQITVNGDNNITFREKISLSAPLERNLEIVDGKE